MYDEPKVHMIKRKYADGKKAYTLRWIDPTTGRYRSLKVDTDSSFAERERSRIKKKLKRGRNGDVHFVSWSEFVEKFMAFYKVETAESTCVDMRHTLDEFGRVCHPAGPQAVSYEMVQKFRLKLVAGNKLVTGNKPFTANKKIKALRTAIRKAKRMGYVDEVPEFKLFETPMLDPNPLTAVSDHGALELR